MKKKFTKQKGITLIALIITIIVMLILVGVTINVALNGGLFTKAKNAAEQTQVEADKETLLSAAMACIGTDGKVVFTGADGLDSHLPAGFSGSNGTYTKGEYTYTVNPNTGKITATKNGSTTPSNLTEIEKYILGENGEGITFMSFSSPTAGFFDGEAFGHNTDNAAYILDASTSVKMVGSIGDSEDELIAYISYNDSDVYKFKVVVTGETEETMAYVTDGTYGLQKLEIPASATNVGKTATINGQKYIVLYDAGEQGENVQLVSANVFETDNVYLGYQDGQIDWTDTDVITAANIFNDTEEGQSVLSDVEKGIYSYNNAIANLNAKCRSIVGNSDNNILNVRSIGSNPTSKNSETSTLYTSTLLGTIPSSSAKYSAGAFNGITTNITINENTDDEREIQLLKGGKGTDQNYITDYERMLVLGINKSENTYIKEGETCSYRYWLASRFVNENSDRVDFSIRYVSHDGNTTDASSLWYVDDCDADGLTYNYGVRPVVSLSSSALQNYLNQ